MQLLSSPFLKTTFYINTQKISVKARWTKNSSTLSQPFNKAAYWAHKNIKGFFKRNRLYSFHLSFMHFSFPVSQPLLEVYHSGNRACIEFSSISQQDAFFSTSARLRTLEVCLWCSQTSGNTFAHLESTFKCRDGSLVLTTAYTICFFFTSSTNYTL